MFEKYVVTADYQKKNKNDISLTAGDIIDVIERNDYGENKKKIVHCLYDLKDQCLSQNHSIKWDFIYQFSFRVQRGISRISMLPSNYNEEIYGPSTIMH